MERRRYQNLGRYQMLKTDYIDVVRHLKTNLYPKVWGNVVGDAEDAIAKDWAGHSDI